MEAPTVPPLPPAGPEEGKPAAMDKEMKPAAVVGIFALIGLSFYFMFTYTGPFQWLAELQLKWMDSYSEKLTFLLAMIVLVIPAAAIWKVIELAVRKMGPGGGGTAAEAATHRKSRDIRLPGVAVLPLVGVIAFGIGAFMYWRGATARPLTALKARDLEVGKKPASSYLSIEGVPMWEETIAFKKTGKECYVPVVSQDWKGQAVSVYVECREDELPRPPGPLRIKTFTGMTAVGGLPGPIRVAFEKTLFKPAAGYLVLQTHDEPAKLMGFAKWPMIVGGGLVAAGLLVWGVKRMVASR
jgi:hypothetical protein